MLEKLPQEWDAIVIGAGVAGAMSALHLARTNLRVLLVEKSEWPREKVCGGCLNAAALRALADADIEIVGGKSYTQLDLGCEKRAANLPLPQGIAISRRHLDALLVEHARAAGAHFLPATRASLGDALSSAREVLLRHGSYLRAVHARLVLDCSGLASKLLPQARWQIARGARIGIGASVVNVPMHYRAGAIHMACARHGYVGVVRAEDGIANIAAALDPVWCGAVGGPAQAIEKILAESGFPRIDALRDVHWHGTPHLTRRCKWLGAERVLILGDAAGYVEPFTGEGMAWALADAAAVVPLAREAIAHWNESIVARWSARHAHNVRARQMVCAAVTRLLRHPRMLGAILPLIDRAPALATPLTLWLNRKFKFAFVVNK